MQTTHGDTNGVLRFGHVAEYDPKRNMARVLFPPDDQPSGWLPALVPSSNSITDFSPVAVGTHVACLMQGEGHEVGVIVGSFYDDTNIPEGDENIWRRNFPDGTSIAYDSKGHSLSINCAGSVSISAAGNVTISGANIYLN